MPFIDCEQWDAQRLMAEPRVAVFGPSSDDVRLRDRTGEALGLALGPASEVLSDAAAQQGLFVAESSKVANRALDAGVEPWSVFLERKWVEKSQQLLDRIAKAHPSVPVYCVTPEQFRLVTGYHVTRGALCSMIRPSLMPVEDVVQGVRRIAVLENINNYTNIGAIFRSAAALNIDAVLLTPTCHDPLFRRAARVSMGTVFQVPWTRIGSVSEWATEGVPLLHRLGFKTVALALRDDSLSIDDARLVEEERLALVLGAEGDGLAAQTIAQCDYTVRIPMREGVDSLNVAAASAVAFWELRAR